MNSPQPDQSKQTLNDVIAECTTALFEAYGVPMTVEATGALPEIDELVVSGTIGFTGEDMRGTLVLCANSQLLDSPAFRDSTSRAWIGELANQLLGRVKNRLLPFGVTIHLSTPMTMHGHNLQPEPNSPESPSFSLVGASERAVVWFDLETSKTLSLVPQPNADAPTQAEGDLLLF